MATEPIYTLDFSDITLQDVPRVGGKNASNGELFHALKPQGVGVLDGFATTAEAYRRLLAEQDLEGRLRSLFAGLDVTNTEALAQCGHAARAAVLETPLPSELRAAILTAYGRLSERLGRESEMAVRSSATAEDLPEASFAGQHESFLNVRGKEHLLKCMHEVYASLFNDRAIAYRVHNNFDHSAVALSVGVQHMVRSDLGSAGVMFTLDTESGFRDVVFITSSYGLGETVVQGSVNPDEFYVYKPALRAGKRSIVRKNIGGKSIKMIYAPPGSNE